MTNGVEPVINIDVRLEGINAKIMDFLETHHMEVETAVQDRLDRMLGEDIVRELIDREVEKAVTESISDSIHRYFKLGDGKRLIKETVDNSLGQTKKQPQPSSFGA